MKLEELLVEQGGDPLTDKINGRSLRAFINAKFKKLGIELLEVSTPCDVILERIYGIEDAEVQSAILNRTVANLKGDVNYKRFSMYAAIILMTIVVGLVLSGGHLPPEAIDALKTIATAVVSLISLSSTGT